MVSGDHRRAEGGQVIGPTGALRVMVATRPVDFRKGADGLAALVREIMQADPFDGAIYVFRAKRADRVKLMFWDGTGVCLFAKRLEEGEFRWPKIEDGVMRLTLGAALGAARRSGLEARAPRPKTRRRRCCRDDLRRSESGLDENPRKRSGFHDSHRRHDAEPPRRFPTIPKR